MRTQNMGATFSDHRYQKIIMFKHFYGDVLKEEERMCDESPPAIGKCLKPNNYLMQG